MILALTLWALLATTAWVLTLARGLVTARRAPRLPSDPPPPAAWPPVSIIVPACDEAATLGAAARTLLAQDYPALELVLVDDRSTDGTTEVARALAREDLRVRVVHVRTLPEGWLGKVHALERGREAATGELLLFTDADVHLAPGALRRAVAHALDLGLDHLALLPRVETAGLAHEAVTCAFAGFLLGTIDLAAVEDPRSKAFLGVGAFNLVRREALARTAGLAWLRLDVADDLALGLLMKQAGARTAARLALDAVRVRWYANLAAMVRGLEKNAFAAVGRYRLGRMVAFATVGLALGLGPLAPIAHASLAPRATAIGWAWAALPPLAIAATSLATAAASHRGLGVRLSALALAPLATVVIGYIALRSAAVCLARGGITWRGTFYPLAALRQGQRVRL